MSNGRVTILDGGMGRELERRGAPFKQPEWSALALMKAPGIVKQVHKDFIRNGAGVISTNSYALVPFHIGEELFQNQGRALAASAGQIACDAVAEIQSSTRIAGSIPPLFGSYRADLYQPERVSEIATPLIEGLSPYVDLWLCETQSLLAEAISVRLLIDNLDDEKKPVWISFTLEDAEVTKEPLLRSGEPVADAVEAMSDLNVEAILFNCCQPEVIGDAIQVTRDKLASLSCLEIEIGAYANAFAPQPKNATANEGLDDMRADLTPSAYLSWAQQWRRKGATLIGGCCGIGPDHIALLAEKLVV
jgi:S-methylmethionine-dependent homocysteine/selenocysteine methylase